MVPVMTSTFESCGFEATHEISVFSFISSLRDAHVASKFILTFGSVFFDGKLKMGYRIFVGFETIPVLLHFIFESVRLEIVAVESSFRK